MRKKKITRQFKNFRIYKDLYGNPCKGDWMAKVVFLIQMLQTFGGRYNRYFRDIRLKILRLANFKMLVQLVLTNFSKANCFGVWKLITWSSHAKSLRKKQSKGKRLKKTVSLLDSVYFKRDFITRNTLDSPLEKKTVQRLSSLKSTMTILRIWKVLIF